jgi:ankyrin repeat protein
MCDQLTDAIENGNIEEVRRFLRDGVDLTQMDVSHCGLPQTEILDLLLDNGFNINQQDEDGFTLLFNAVSCGYVDLVKYLLSHGADLGITPFKTTCLHVSVKHDDMFELILKHLDKDLNSRDDCGSTPLHCAVFNGSLKVIQTLLDRGVDCNALDNIGQTPLHYLSYQQNINVAQIFLQYGANPDIIDRDGHIAKDNLIRRLNMKDQYIATDEERISNIIKLLDSYSKGQYTKRAKIN